MNNTIIQLILLAAVAIFLILRLKSVLGTRDGFERPPQSPTAEPEADPQKFTVIDGGPDHDIIDHVPEGSSSASALAAMKRLEPSFEVGGFLKGARSAYEMILMAFEKGDLDEVRPFLSAQVYDAFSAAIADRKARGLTVEAEFMGLREMTLDAATIDGSNDAELTVRFVGELVSVSRDAQGNVVEGDPRMPRKQRDIWTFARKMGASDPNWQLVATGG
ncbi:Tim44/TimA family putative adaptor protein [Thioclava sp. GXIMD4216]|uniref:Tim44/TimA family putative adaptor protein n=1 Tax=Thioclava litoralis TaxID=3076557 RepID=A0ABZ1DV20_9RHOB|nr:Tim44/TimA family putative adaptor protein [Thioclava sp. FTW29]